MSVRLGVDMGIFESLVNGGDEMSIDEFAQKTGADNIHLGRPYV